MRGKIFATVPGPRLLNVMVDEFAIRLAVRSRPEACSERWWGKRLAAVTLRLRAADAALVRDLLRAAWERKAPAALKGRTL